MMERKGRADYKYYEKYRVSVPTGKSGPWSIEKFTTQMDIAYLRHCRDGRPPGIGTFTKLLHEDRGIVMSDTVAEMIDVIHFLSALKGHVLVTGLGLGMVPHILTKTKEYSKDVKSVTVIEKDRHIIKLVGKFYRDSDPRIKIICADAFTWQPPRSMKYDAAWHDIWDCIDDDNRSEMTRMRRHFQRSVKGGKQFCWGERKQRGGW